METQGTNYRSWAISYTRKLGRLQVFCWAFSPSFLMLFISYSLCPQKSVGNGGMSSLSDLVWDLYDVHCCMVNFHWACGCHRHQGIDKWGGEEEWQVQCLCPVWQGDRHIQRTWELRITLVSHSLAKVYDFNTTASNVKTMQ